jgi:hypothetical protein
MLGLVRCGDDQGGVCLGEISRQPLDELPVAWVGDMNQAEARCKLLGTNAQVVQAGTRPVQLALAAEFVQQQVMGLLLADTGTLSVMQAPPAGDWVGPAELAGGQAVCPMLVMAFVVPRDARLSVSMDTW